MGLQSPHNNGIAQAGQALLWACWHTACGLSLTVAAASWGCFAPAELPPYAVGASTQDCRCKPGYGSQNGAAPCHLCPVSKCSGNNKAHPAVQCGRGPRTCFGDLLLGHPTCLISPRLLTHSSAALCGKQLCPLHPLAAAEPGVHRLAPILRAPLLRSASPVPLATPVNLVLPTGTRATQWHKSAPSARLHHPGLSPLTTVAASQALAVRGWSLRFA